MENEQLANDSEVAKMLQRFFDAQEKHLQAIKESLARKPKAPDAPKKSGRSENPPRDRPAPMDQVPPSSNLFKVGRGKAAAAPNPNSDLDDSSSSSSDSTDAGDHGVPDFLNMHPRSKKKKARKSKRSKSSKKNPARRSRRSGDPPSSSDSSDSDSSSSSINWSSLGSEPSEIYSDDSVQTKRQKKRAKKSFKMKLLRLRLEQSHAKPDPPSIYNGEANFNKIERWVLEGRDWKKQCYIRPNMRVQRVSKYLGGRALDWYMREGAKAPHKWTLNRFYEALFNYCFPVDFRSIQRKKFQTYEQRSQGIQEYRTNLETLANSVGDITSRQLVVQFWDGASFEMRRRWAASDEEFWLSHCAELMVKEPQCPPLLCNTERQIILDNGFDQVLTIATIGDSFSWVIDAALDETQNP
ncbi:hypothetical protein B0H13DRAFT_2473677 [Mycena leptocephala]|nr:hypothetical protein B0H13DRAFT_2473677 [Mycena leptocephala]